MQPLSRQFLTLGPRRSCFTIQARLTKEYAPLPPEWAISLPTRRRSLFLTTPSELIRKLFPIVQAEGQVQRYAMMWPALGRLLCRLSLPQLPTLAGALIKPAMLKNLQD